MKKVCFFFKRARNEDNKLQKEKHEVFNKRIARIK